MSKAKKSNMEEAMQYFDDHIVDPFTDGEVSQKMSQYAKDMKNMAKNGAEEINEGMMEIGENVSSMMEAFKNHQEVERFQSDVKSGLNKLGKSARKVVDDVKDMMD